MKGIGILPEERVSYIDHLIPLCQILHIPVLVTELWIQELIEHYYPPMEVIFAQPEDYSLDPFLEPYQYYLYVDFFRKGNGSFEFGNYVSRRKVPSFFSFHGNSDKNWEIFWIERIKDERNVLFYGPQNLDWLASKGIKKEVIFSSNYRFEFYRKYKSFFDIKVPKLKSEQKTILYAPTWSSRNFKSELRFYYSSFFEAHAAIFEHVPEEYKLIVKLHPHHVFLMKDEISSIQKKYPHIYFLNEMPLIYPILEQIDYYVGDFSSIGYDFLVYDRPLFLINVPEMSPLAGAGCVIKQGEIENLYDILKQEKKDPLKEKRQALYRYAFGESKSLDLLKHEMLSCLC